MKSISIKIKLATVLAVSVMAGIVLYAKADMNSVDESENSAYTITSSATTNLNASMKAHPRASEYTSSEYTTKMAPATTGAAEFLAVHQDKRDGNTYQRRSVPQGDGDYRRKEAPTTHPKPAPVNTEVQGETGQRSPQSANTTYKTYGVRAASTKNIETNDASTEIAESKTAVISSDGYARRSVAEATDYANSIENAAKSDNAYQVRSAPQGTNPPAGNTYGGYAVRSAQGADVSTAQQQNKSSEGTYGGYNVRSVKAPSTVATRNVAVTEDGYAKRRVQESATNIASTQTPQTYNGTTPSKGTYGGYAIRSAGGADVATAQKQPATASGETYKGYARRSVNTPESATSLAQYDNAKHSDEVYQVKSAPVTTTSGESYGGYAVRSVKAANTSTAQKSTSNDSYGGYAVKSAGSGSTSRNLATAEGGYARRRAPEGIAGGSSSTPTTDYAQQRPTPQSTGNSYGGYAVKSAGGKDVATAQAPTPSGESYGGYAVRKAGQKRQTASIAQYDNATQSDNAYNKAPASSGDTYGGYAVRSAGGKDVATAQTTAPSGESYGGYAVRSAGQKRQTTSIAQVTPAPAPRVARRGIGTPASTGIKIYDNRGQQVNLNTSQRDRSVLVMPKRGRSIAGVVIQDDPGRSIVVQSSAGTQSTYRYGEIDALVNL